MTELGQRAGSLSHAGLSQESGLDLDGREDIRRNRCVSSLVKEQEQESIKHGKQRTHIAFLL